MILVSIKKAKSVNKNVVEKITQSELKGTFIESKMFEEFDD